MAYVDYRAIDAAYSDSVERYKAMMVALDESRVQVAAEAKKRLKERGYMIRNVAEHFGIDNGGISRGLNNAFRFPCWAIAEFANRFCGCTAQELLFGEPMSMELPRPIAALVLVFRQLGPDEQTDILTSMRISKAPWLENQEDYAQVHKARLDERCELMGVTVQVLFWDQVATNTRLQLQLERVKDGCSSYLVPMMYISHVLELPIDYFFARDYSYLDLFCVDENDKISRLTKEERRLVSQYLRMDETEQNKLAVRFLEKFITN